jgi:hypothetical protein
VDFRDGARIRVGVGAGCNGGDDKGVSLRKLAAICFAWFYMGVTRVLQECYEGVARVLQGCYKGVSRML